MHQRTLAKALAILILSPFIAAAALAVLVAYCVAAFVGTLLWIAGAKA